MTQKETSSSGTSGLLSTVMGRSAAFILTTEMCWAAAAAVGSLQTQSRVSATLVHAVSHKRCGFASFCLFCSTQYVQELMPSQMISGLRVAPDSTGVCGTTVYISPEIAQGWAEYDDKVSWVPNVIES